MTYGEKLRTMRMAAGLTQPQLGAACEYPPGSADRIVRMWETDKQFPPIDKLRLLAAALKKTLDDVVP